MSVQIETYYDPHVQISIQTSTQAKTLFWESLVLGLFTSILSFVLGLWLVFHVGIIQGDAYTRMLNAYYALFGSKFHLAAVGFVWNPLPSFVEMPFLLLRHWFPALLDYGIAAIVQSAIFAGIAAYFFNRIVARFGFSRGWRLPFSLLFILNPMILYFSSNGMSEPMMISSMLGTLDGVIGYVRDKKLSDMVKASIWLAVCFLARYEAVPFAVFVVGLMAVGMLRNGWKRQHVEAFVLTLAIPITYMAIAWVLSNWMIMKNPLYFLNSAYSDVGQAIDNTAPIILQAKHHIFNDLTVVLEFTRLFPPVLLTTAVFLGLMVRRKADPIMYGILGASMAIPVLQSYMIYKGTSDLWSRYFIMYIVCGLLGLAYLASRSRKRTRFFAASLALLVMLGGDIYTGYSQTNVVWGKGVADTFNPLLEGKTVANSLTNNNVTLARVNKSGKAIADYIQAHPHDKFLLDTFTEYLPIPFLKNANQVVITADTNFNSVLLNPKGQVNYFLVPEPVGASRLDAINRAYPGLYAGKVSWARLVKQFNEPLHTRLYEILPSAP